MLDNGSREDSVGIHQLFLRRLDFQAESGQYEDSHGILRILGPLPCLMTLLSQYLILNIEQNEIPPPQKGVGGNIAHHHKSSGWHLP